MEKTEYFVYCGFFMAHLWGKRFAHIPKGEFLEVPCSLAGSARRHFVTYCAEPETSLGPLDQSLPLLGV